MNKEKRYAVTVDFYIYAESDEDAKQQAREAKLKMEVNDFEQANVVSIHEVPFGKIGKSREVK